MKRDVNSLAMHGDKLLSGNYDNKPEDGTFVLVAGFFFLTHELLAVARQNGSGKTTAPQAPQNCTAAPSIK
jgi:hypothetical protein